MPVWCAQTWAQWRWHGRMIQDACTGAAVALSAQWTWALPQIPHRPAGWRHVTLHPPRPDKSWVCSAVCAAPRGPGPLLHSQRAWMEAGRLRGRDTGRRCVVTQRRNVWGRCRFIHACGFLLFDGHPGDFYFDSEWISGRICVRTSAPVMTHDCRLDTSEEMNAESVQTTAIEFLYEFTVENDLIYSFSALTGTWWRF